MKKSGRRCRETAIIREGCESRGEAGREPSVVDGRPLWGAFRSRKSRDVPVGAISGLRLEPGVVAIIAAGQLGPNELTLGGSIR